MADSPSTVYIPVYFQACKGHSPIRSGVDLLPYSFSVAPAAIFIGATTSKFNCYRIQNVIAWGFVLVGLGLQTTLHVDSAVRNWVGFEFIAGIGFGMLVRPYLQSTWERFNGGCHTVRGDDLPYPGSSSSERQWKRVGTIHLHSVVLLRKFSFLSYIHFRRYRRSLYRHGG